MRLQVESYPLLVLDKRVLYSIATFLYSPHRFYSTSSHSGLRPAFDLGPSCEYKTLGVYTKTRYLYICDEHGLLLEFWKHFYDNQSHITKFTCLWQRTDLHYIARYCLLNRGEPSPIGSGYITYKPHPLIGSEPEQPVIQVGEGRSRTREDQDNQADLEYRSSPAGRLQGY